MTDAPFRPFETYLDEATALAVLREATAGADDGELFLERKRSEAIVLDDGRIKTASYDASEGFGLRAIRGEVAGYAHSTEISEQALRQFAATRLADFKVPRKVLFMTEIPKGATGKLQRIGMAAKLGLVPAT